MKHLDSDFSPSLIHPYYFIRTGLKNEVLKYSSYLSGRLMDFGCGSKPYQSFFQVEEYTGVDFENEGHPHQNEQIDVFYDGQTIPLPEEYFDSILCTEVFEHIFNLDAVLQELNRVLKINGHILITCPFVWNEHEVPYDYARYTRFALKSLLDNNGFEIIEYSKSGDFISTIVQLITLYFNSLFKGMVRKVFFLRWIFKILFFLLPNIVGVILIKLLPKNDSLYLNNVLVVKKINSDV